MLKSKSFRINHEFDKKPSVHELLYEPKRIRWMKFFVIPLLIAFSLLLVLSNVNFSGESYELVVAPSGASHAIATPTPTAEVITTASSDYNLQTDNVGLDSVEGDNVAEEEDGEEKKDVGAVDVAVQHWSEALAAVPAKTFTCDDNRTCKTIICSGGPIFTILNEIEYFLKWCESNENNFDVIIEDCTFNKNTISKYTFAGTFKLTSLTIRNCQLNTIDDNAFKLQSVNELMNLTFVGVQLKALNAQTFIGLEALTNFQLFNVLTQTTSPLNANNFLQPMAASLSNLVLQQTEDSCSSNTIYDPTRWLGGNSATVYSQLLYVDLSGTNFNDTLNGNTFEKLSAVQKLQLNACSLSMIAENVFHGISSTLKSLDLRNNQLRTLDGGFLATATVKDISIEFGKNLWSCDCDNVEIIGYMKQVRNNSADEAVCATPTPLQGTQIRSAKLSCYDTTSLTTFMTTISTTAATTTTTSESTTITTTIAITIETTETQPETRPTFSTNAMNNSTPLTSPPSTTVTSPTTDSTTEETTGTMDTTYTSSSITSIYSSTSSSAPMTITSTTTDYLTNTIVTTPASTPATTDVTDVSESTDITLRSTIKTTLSPTTSITPNSSTMVATTTTETIAPPSSPMTTTTEDDATTETAESIATNTPQQTSTTQIIFPGTTIIPIPTTNSAATTETTSTRIDTTEIEHTTNIKTTATTPPATTVPPTTTCYRNTAPKFLVCTDIIAIKLCDYDVAFNVVPISSRSVQLQIGGNATGLQAIYLPELNDSNIEYIEIGNNRNIDIDDLAPNSSYTFCLIPKGEMRTSPFNCRSTHLAVETAQPWLEYSDVGLFYTIAVLITVVCVIFGVAVIYFLLRWRPTLLYGNKRVHRIASTSHEVLLFPKPVRSSVDSKTYALSELSKMHASVSDTLTPENYLNIKSYDYMQYFKNAELEKQRKVAHISLNQPPAHRAPALPPNVWDAAAQRSDRERHESAAPKLPAAPVDVLENEYESLDYYQELY